MPVRIAVIAEAEADRQQVCETIDRKLLHHAPSDWTNEDLAVRREYCGLKPGTVFTRWLDLKHLPSSPGAFRGSAFIGFRKNTMRFDYPLGSKALKSAVLAKPEIHAVVLVRDMDQQAKERRQSLEDARSEMEEAFPIVLALAEAKREAWVLNGFEPRDKVETKRLREISSELKFDPRMAPERLATAKKGAKRDAKRVLKHLVHNDRDREAGCWRETPWNLLRERGTGSGLSSFLEEVKRFLLPLVIPSPKA